MVLAVCLAVSLTGCLGLSPRPEPNAPEANRPESPASEPTTRASRGVSSEFLTSPNPGAALQQALGRLRSQAGRLVVPADAVTIAVYVPDDQCLGYVTEEVLVSRQDDLAQTVELILAKGTIPLLQLSGYRLSRDPDTRTVTIDLRVSRASPRLLQSLSLCEQKILLGSLKETLVNHPTWEIDRVEFTQRGHRLVL
jgi:hypothetical protein